MTLKIDRSFVLRLQGRLNSQTSQELRHQVAELLVRCGSAESGDCADLWVMDLGGVDFIDSSGLSALVMAHKTACQRGYALAFCNLQSEVRMVFDIAQVDRVLAVFDRYEAAIAAWEAGDKRFSNRTAA